jgi:hypothetical protein
MPQDGAGTSETTVATETPGRNAASEAGGAQVIVPAGLR